MVCYKNVEIFFKYPNIVDNIILDEGLYDDFVRLGYVRQQPVVT